MADVESRFQHLLQPIRDLTRNWEVDVATQLGEYLEEVRGVLSPLLGMSGWRPWAMSVQGFCLHPQLMPSLCCPQPVLWVSVSLSFPCAFRSWNTSAFPLTMAKPP